MIDLYKYLKTFKGKKLLLVFPHPDDEAYVSGGLLQMAQKLSIQTKLICLTKGGRGLAPEVPDTLKKLKEIRTKELRAACNILGVDEMVLWDYPDAGLLKNRKKWSLALKKEIEKSKAAIILTFDSSGVTGHPDHLAVSKEVYLIVKSFSKKPELLFRVPDKQEMAYFKDNKLFSLALKPTHILSYSFNVTLKKIAAIFAHKSQLKDFKFKMQILDWFLFNHQELYHLVDFKKDYSSNITFSRGK